ncbi:nucleotidyltransferase family protein [Psychrobacter arenosus]|uniref:nucleotidyltransferase family protein n=1 Tax=Psychrobacter arenosus TaxID=256326 RepID=UPI001918A30E|nr:nucleotidyltransferase domain-containing protein [Psychrobacter arenosus]
MTIILHELPLNKHFELTTEQIRTAIFGYPVEALYVFGSALRDDFDADSDMDLLIEISPDAHLSYFDLMAIKENFSKILQRPVDLVEKQAIKNPYRRAEILRTAKKIYDGQ